MQDRPMLSIELRIWVLWEREKLKAKDLISLRILIYLVKHTHKYYCLQDQFIRKKCRNDKIEEVQLWMVKEEAQISQEWRQLDTAKQLPLRLKIKQCLALRSSKECPPLQTALIGKRQAFFHLRDLKPRMCKNEAKEGKNYELHNIILIASDCAEFLEQIVLNSALIWQ